MQTPYKPNWELTLAGTSASQNPFKVKVSEIRNIKILQTIKDGEIIYEQLQK